ncbi:Filamin/ABP280 repeat-containing protein, partial [Cardiosporidium cionae]
QTITDHDISNYENTPGEYKTITCSDHLASKCKVGKPESEVESDGQILKMEGTVEDYQDGNYTAMYSATKAGKYILSILYNNNRHIANSPYTVFLEPRSADAEHCTIEAAASNSTQLIQIETKELIIQSRDKFDNLITRGGQKFVVKGLGGAKILQLTDKKDGRHILTYAVFPEQLNSFCEIQAFLDGKHIKGSPRKLTVPQNHKKNPLAERDSFK